MTRIIILAAGQGTRLRPHTDAFPKTMVPVGGKPIIEYQLAVYQALGLSDVSIVSGYCEQKLKVYSLPQYSNPEFEDTNMVYSLMSAKALFDGQEDVIVVYGDILFEPEVLQGLLHSPGDIVVSADKQWESLWRLRMEDPLADAETFEYDAQQRLLSLGKTPTSCTQIQAQYIGLIRFSASVAAQLAALYASLAESLSRQAHRQLYMTDFIQMMIDRGMQVKCHFIERQWLEVDSVSDLATYNELLANGDFSRLGFKPH